MMFYGRDFLPLANDIPCQKKEPWMALIISINRLAKFSSYLIGKGDMLSNSMHF